MFKERCYYGNRFINSNYLEHWRYIKKTRVNGKWRYYYDRDQMRKDLGYDAKEKMLERRFKEAEAKTKRDAAMSIASDAYKKTSGTRKGRFETIASKAIYDNTVKAALKYDQEYREAKEIAKVYTEKYEKTPIGRIDKASRTFKKGVKKVSKFLSKIFKKKKTKKEIKSSSGLIGIKG